MTDHPSDLAAIRALVEAVERITVSVDGKRYFVTDNGIPQQMPPRLESLVRKAIVPATAALASLEESAKSFRDRWCSLCEGPGLIGANGEWYCPLCLIVEQHGKLARLEGLTEEAVRSALNAALMLPTRSPVMMNDEALTNMARAVLALLRGAK